jgi:hypothetical protein
MELILVVLKNMNIWLCFPVLGCKSVLYAEKIFAVCPIFHCEHQKWWSKPRRRFGRILIHFSFWYQLSVILCYSRLRYYRIWNRQCVECNRRTQVGLFLYWFFSAIADISTEFSFKKHKRGVQSLKWHFIRHQYGTEYMANFFLNCSWFIEIYRFYLRCERQKHHWRPRRAGS